MKKIYESPKMGRAIEICEDLICLSEDENAASKSGVRLYMESKERENIDFSDEESIW